MRWYAVLFGIVLTLAEYGAIERAATAPHRERRIASVPGVSVRRGPLDVVWHGGTLDPVVVEARKGSALGDPAAKGAERQSPTLSARTQRLGVARLCEDLRLNPSIER